MNHIKTALVALAWMCLIAGASRAETGGAFLDDVRQAYPHYKLAWFYARTGNGGLSMLELTGFEEKWKAIVARYGETPPPKFAADPAWRQSLASISATIVRARADAEAGRNKQCAQTLLAIRQELRALRRRSGVTVFSDLVDDYGDSVDELSRTVRGMKHIRPEDVATFRQLSVRMKAAIARIENGAPEDLKSEFSFVEAVKANYRSIAKFEQSLTWPSVEGIKGAIGSVRADYRLLFLRYG